MKPNGPEQSQIDLALDPAWKNSAKRWLEIEVPTKTVIYEGVASSINTKVGKILGGGSQVYIKKVKPEWISDFGVF